MIKNIKIRNKTIGRGNPVFIIAEAGVNHNGRLDLALKLVDAAADAGADAVKFQTFKAEQVVTEAGVMADYQKKNIGKTSSQMEMLRRFELKEKFYKPIINKCRKKNILFLSTPHGHVESVNFLHNLGVAAFKIGSGDLTNFPLLKHSARLRKPMIVSTGMATLQEIKEAVNIIKKSGNHQIVVLHCTTNYPTPPEEVNLRAMQTMMKKLNVPVGYSDHTLGAQVPVMAVTLGACVIEKHLTLGNDMPGPDHKASANPEVFKKMVDEIRRIETIMGSSEKNPLPGELKLRAVVRKSVVAIRDIKKGEKFNPRNLGLKRPGTGLEPKYFHQVIGKLALADIRADELIKKEHYAEN